MPWEQTAIAARRLDDCHPRFASHGEIVSSVLIAAGKAPLVWPGLLQSNDPITIPDGNVMAPVT
jgi:hypothetical protein